VTRHLILAVNAYLPGLGYLGDRLMPMTLTASLTQPLSEAEQAALGHPSEWGVISAHRMGATVRYTRDRRIFIRNTAEFVPRVTMNAAALERRRRLHERGFRARFPMLSEVPLEHTWSGVICVTRNFSSFFGRLAENVYAAVAYNGSGIARGTIAGTLLADYALGADSELLSLLLESPAPAWIPPRPFLDLGARFEIARARAGLGREL
jgi:glycine/D-amino acid oxidase-like deaminating enzyme